ncbi:histidine--tRNA ligase [Phormidesmis priestleyi ULC007]|uniref:Histidine--tRNA ligase n=1 Tax=Phormidesmis priestleyi ULC007 TaxID=1920490 RepID=A0A2T1DNN3_9CYAN|nr:histidine--tRNA ligase [Phormidesmis priestleyi]PSB22108.1 histidine--tRNA ligase [Phormidesmis priestleyi ULC007]PZO54924.1 MAG: histidine--tRNA ligase [Phormidesmis priestleyi]
MSSIQASRGTRDILPDEVSYWQRVETIVREILVRAAYQEIRTPIFEQTALFERGMGEATDVVNKEMYTFKDRGDRSLTIRPEGTAGVARSYIEHNLHAQGGVQRLWYAGAMFRYERPQAGRQRQFHQLGVEVLGSGDVRADAEAIALATEILQTLGLKDLRLDLNSIGDANDRQTYREALVNYLTPFKEELDADSQDRLTRNPLRILDSKDPRTQTILDQAPSILDYLGSDSQRRFDRVQQLLSDLGIACNINSRLVRGLDYYTHTVFEIQSDDLGAQATVCAGGRYDGLVSELGGPETPAIGWAMGLERLILLLQQIQPVSPSKVDFYVVSRGEKAESQALILAQLLRRSGFTIELDLSGSAFGKQFKRADRSGAVACLILGDSEAETKTVQLKWLKSGEQTAIEQSALLETIADLRTKISHLKDEN